MQHLLRGEAEAGERTTSAVIFLFVDPPVAPSESRFICKVIAKVPPDMSKLAAQRDSIRQDLRTRKARERMELFRDSLRNSLARDGKIKINKDVVDRIVASYRG